MPVINRGIVKKKPKAKPKPSSSARKVTTLADVTKKKQKPKPKPKPSSSIKRVITLADIAKSDDKREDADHDDYHDEDFILGDDVTDDEADPLPDRKTDLVPDEIERVHPDGTFEVVKVPVEQIKGEEECSVSEAQADEQSNLVRARRVARFSTLFETAKADTMVEGQTGHSSFNGTPINGGRQAANRAEERAGKLRGGRVRVSEGRRLGP